MNYRRVICIIISSVNDTGICAQIPADDLNKLRNCSLASLKLRRRCRRRHHHHHHHHHHNHHHHLLLLLLLLLYVFSSIFCSLLAPINNLKHNNASFIEFRTFSQLQNRHCPLLRARVRLRFLSLTRGSVLPNFNKMTNLEFLIMRFQKIENIFSTGLTLRRLMSYIWSTHS